ncbi:MAG: DoxX family protein [Anaerolineae bacterium]
MGQTKGNKMNVILWALQIVLAVKFISVAYTHGIRPDQTKMQRGIQRLGTITRPLLTLIALCTFLGGIGLILPAATGILAWLTPWSAALLALMMLLAIGFHVACRESPNIVVGLILFALAAFVAYGRWVMAPF